ncbi:MAG: bifunctional phosphopantothenoylcysteine decarboxylase/phosphopantothenate--cysteine ligase CoaBC [Calditrichaeota bacterium]|nr:bifunctional phosphopantothenoylcysteine decarboxylase/phosphopantothenate--cysteine ligase CoaBC [Calditrichota bacterium]
MFRDRKIVVGVTGGIAAYKVCEFIRYLVTRGSQLRVMMTRSATEFITPLTLETLSGHPVYRELFPQDTFSATQHVNLADWAETIAVVPATANILGKFAGGIADDFVSSTLLAAHCPILFAPAMNHHMWENPFVQQNLERIRQAGHEICPPEYGFLAEGYEGMGRLARLEYLIQSLYRTMHPARDSLQGKTVLITAGPTREPLDPVRYFSNFSSGKMGLALAWEAFARGARVILIHGPIQLTPPFGMECVAVETARQMHQAVLDHYQDADWVISAAAVADFRPKRTAEEKIKKSGTPMQLELEANPDILATVAKERRAGQLIIGFAVETHDGEKNARRKLQEKSLDAIVLNNPLEKGAGFAVDTNRVTLLHRNGTRVELDIMYKLDVARKIFDFVLEQSP